MSGGTRLTLCAALATLTAACALLPLVDSGTWLLQAGLLLVVQSSAGAVTRRVPLARSLTVAIPAVLSLLLLTVVFAREQALAGVLPGPGAIRALGDLMSAGGDDVSEYTTPVPLSEGIRLLLITGVLVVGLVVDTMAVTYRAAAPAGLPLLALYSIAAGLSDGGHEWLWFLVAAAGFLLLLLAEGRDRLSRWGRVFGGPSAQGRGGAAMETADGSPQAPVRTGRRIGVLALGIALVVPAALPTLEDGVVRKHTGKGGGHGGEGGDISAVNPLVSLQNNLNQPADREVLRYRTSTDHPQDLYMRIVALDQFDGTSWKPSERQVTEVPQDLPMPPGLSSTVHTVSVDTTVRAAEWYAQSWLPMPYPASRVRIDGRWRFEPVGRTLVGDRGQTTKGARYSVASLVVRPTADQLAHAPDPPSSLQREYTQVPDSLPSVVAKTAREVTTGTSNSYERAVKLQDWFSSDGGFRYDTTVRAGSGADAITRFLKDKEGFCVHFSFSMAAMARTLGIPARVAVGFTPGTARSDGSMSVGAKDAHAWPELYFQGVGWTRFEPTPSRGSQPDYTVERPPSQELPDPEPSQSAEPDVPEPAPSASDDCTADMKRRGDCDTAAVSVDSGSGGGPSPWRWLGWSPLALAVLLVPLLPMAWRLRTRARRLAAATGGADGTLALWQELLDTGWDHGVAPDRSRTPRQAADRLVTEGGLTGAAADAARRVALAAEQVLYAPAPPHARDAPADTRQVVAGLRTAVGRRRRARALLAPRSTIRVMRVAAGRCSRTMAARTAALWRRAARLTLRRPSGQQS